jgi:effector-binding domain-containing protein
MTVVSKIDLYEQPEQHVLSIRTTIRFAEYSQTARQAFGKIQAYAAQNNLLLAGCPFVCYYNVDLDHLDIEIGFPVARPISGNGDIVGRTIPVQKVVSAIFLGAYEETDPLMIEIMQWITEHGYEQHGTIFNYYLNDDNRPKSELLTKIAVQVK